MATPAKFPAAQLALADVGGDVINNGELDLLTTVIATTLTIVATAAIPAGWPQAGFILIDNEIIKHTSWAGSTFTVPAVAPNGRGFDGTTAAGHTAGAKIRLTDTALRFNQAIAEIIALEQALKGIYSIITYGAAEGADCTTAITNAVIAANAAGGGRVFVPPTSTFWGIAAPGVPMLDKVTIFGVGVASMLKLLDSQAASTRMIKATTKSNLVIRDLGFDGNQANQSADSGTQQSHCIFIENTCVNVRIENCDIKNASGDGIFVYGATAGQANTFILIFNNDVSATRRQGISIGGLRYFAVMGNRVRDGLTGGGNQGGGIHIEADNDGMPTTDGSIVGNNVKAAYKGGITCGGNPTGTTQANFRTIVIDGNTVEGTSDAANGSGIEVNGFIGVSISANTVRGSAQIGIYFRGAEASIKGNTITDTNHEAMVLDTVGGSTVLARVNCSGNTCISSNLTQIGPYGTITCISLIDSIVSANILYGVGGNNYGIWLTGTSLRNQCNGNNLNGVTSNQTAIREDGSSNQNSICSNTLINFTTPVSYVGALTIVRDNNPDTSDQVWSRRLLSAIGLYAANLTAVTAFATNTSYFVYIGKAPAQITTLDLVARVTAAVATITWAEVGVFKGTPVANGAVSLTRLGFTDVSATFNSTGIKKTTIALTGVKAGDDLWLAFGSQATTPYQVRGLLADDIQSGVYQTFAGRISTMAQPTTAALASATEVPPWCQAKL